MKLESAGATDVGLKRVVNEDAYCIVDDYALLVVADGMGGHRAGDVASQMATGSIRDFFDTTAGEDSTWPFEFDPSLNVEQNRLLSAIKLANRRIFDASSQRGDVRGMGTTVVGALFSPHDRNVYIAHVGDSRAYRFRDGKLTPMTRDHSLVNDYMLVMPPLTEKQRNDLPKNVITRALGMQESVVVDLAQEPGKVGDIYLLCSDGLSGMVDDDALAKVLQTHAKDDLSVPVKALIEAGNEAGGEDNITVVLGRISDDD